MQPLVDARGCAGAPSSLKTPPASASAWCSKRSGASVAASAEISIASSSSPSSAPIEQQPCPRCSAGSSRMPRQPRPQMQVHLRLEEVAVEAPHDVAGVDLLERLAHVRPARLNTARYWRQRGDHDERVERARGSRTSRATGWACAARTRQRPRCRAALRPGRAPPRRPVNASR